MINAKGVQELLNFFTVKTDKQKDDAEIVMKLHIIDVHILMAALEIIGASREQAQEYLIEFQKRSEIAKERNL